jgi:hypothetical protein
MSWITEPELNPAGAEGCERHERRDNVWRVGADARAGGVDRDDGCEREQVPY